MTRLYEPAAYGPQGRCFWADTVQDADWPPFEADASTDVAVIGGGFTGLSAALHLAECGSGVTVLEAEHAGWGASGRNGGFCCLGGAKASSDMLRRQHGDAALRDWRATERAAIGTVEALVERFGMAVDRHSDGETLLAHSPRAWAAMQSGVDQVKAEYGIAPRLIPRERLHDEGLGGPWLGALTTPLGFALNPRKYHAGLGHAAARAGAVLHARSPVTTLRRTDGGWILDTPRGRLRAGRVLLATNGYSREDLPDWLRGRYLPVQSSVIVTRPLSGAEQAAQGWTSAQMAYDSRFLLHYFRLMPDGRFLFGMRGGLLATPRAQAAVSRRIRADFARLFPEWHGVEITHEWSGLVCLMAGLTPFVGAVPEHPGLFAAMGFHGNGVAMGSHAGRLAASAITGRDPETPYPAFLRMAPRRFPLGRYRRALLAPAYAVAGLFDL